MNNFEKKYLDLVKNILGSGEIVKNRTGIDCYKIPATIIQHNMAEGFPIITTKKIAWKTLKVELEGFIKGLTSKKWFQERGCKIWDQWCNPQKVAYNCDPDTFTEMKEEDDLGPCLYGASWRNFHDPLAVYKIGNRIDQFQNIIDTIKTNPEDRRMLCLAWNPLGLKHTALPACHVLFRVGVRNGKLDLTWYQRSVDVFLGLPFNISSYALLLHLLAKESNLEEGILTGFLDDVHIYENHLEQCEKQIKREPFSLPKIKTEKFNNVFNWEYKDSILENYEHHETIKAEVAI